MKTIYKKTDPERKELKQIICSNCGFTETGFFTILPLVCIKCEKFNTFTWSNKE